jgi:hypothetical protein
VKRPIPDEARAQVNRAKRAPARNATTTNEETKMTLEEAQRQAVQRIGPSGYAEIIGSDNACVIESRDGKIHGYGSTFEEAFQMPDIARATGAAS